jgi:hypothetical protein
MEEKRRKEDKIKEGYEKGGRNNTQKKRKYSNRKESRKRIFLREQ